MNAQNEIARCNRELNQVREALRSPKIGLFASRKLYRRLEQLHRQIESLEIDGAINDLELTDYETTYQTEDQHPAHAGRA